MCVCVCVCVCARQGINSNHAQTVCVCVRARARAHPGFDSMNAQTARFNILASPTSPANHQFTVPCGKSKGHDVLIMDTSPPTNHSSCPSNHAMVHQDTWHVSAAYRSPQPSPCIPTKEGVGARLGDRPQVTSPSKKEIDPRACGRWHKMAFRRLQALVDHVTKPEPGPKPTPLGLAARCVTTVLY